MKCLNCGNKFEKRDIQQKYCSKKCKTVSHQRRVRERRKLGLNPRFLFICQNCKKEFFGYDLNMKYCSRNCAHKARKKYLDIPSCLKSADRKIDKNIGYVRVYCPMHKEANTRGYVYEHRLIAEKMLGRDLLPKEVVHHINGIRWDNRPKNLKVMNKYDHSRICGCSVEVTRYPSKVNQVGSTPIIRSKIYEKA